MQLVKDLKSSVLMLAVENVWHNFITQVVLSVFSQ